MQEVSPPVKTAPASRALPMHRPFETRAAESSRPAHGPSWAFFHWGTGVVGWIAILAAVILPMHGLGIPVCTFLMATNLPCPGCGLTRSVTSIFHGEFLWAWRYNPIGYVVAAVFVLMASVLLLPPSLRERWREEPPISNRAWTRIVLALLATFLLFGFVRIVTTMKNGRGDRWWEDRLPAAYRDSIKPGS